MEIDIATDFGEQRVKSAGTKAPNFTLPDQHDDVVTLQQLISNGMALLFLYSRDGDPGVSEELATLNEYQERFEKLGITPVAISQDDVATHKKYTSENNITLPLLADPENEVSEAYGTHYDSGVNARVSFIISRELEIVRVYTDQRVRSHIKEIYTNVKETLVD
ncbi:MAG: putative peroxiredoxin bcp [Candidatus Marinimicrobia bacterium]|nr:putative peroxiredoxin bcp [Candidatus Neomarinimicrobiota bacterium]